jgi:outer membrane protein insertion porin family
MIGVGVSTNNGLLGSVSFTQHNFDLFAWPNSERRFWQGEAFKGAGQTLRITVEPGTELTRAYLDWEDPSLMDGPFSLANRIFYFERQWDKYQENRYGDVLSLGRRFPNSWYAEVAQRVEGVLINHVDDDAAPEIKDAKGTSLVLGTKGTLIRDRTDNRWMPSEGDRLRLSYEEVYGSYTFGKIGADYHIYRTLYQDELERKHVLSGKIEAAQIVPEGVAPVFEEYYAGGSGSIRGFKYRGISPRSDGTDQAIGGDWLFLAGSEYEFPLIGKIFRGVTFLDTGTVEDRFGFSHYRVSIGTGLRLALPFLGQVPMSLDFGIPLMKQSQDDTQLVSFSFGAQF